MEADILEAAACGDKKTIASILSTDSSLVNFQHRMNGWTALHWAAKRGHFDVARLLVENGADPSLHTSDGKLPADLTVDKDVLQLLDDGRTLQSKIECTLGLGKAVSEVGYATEKASFEPSYLKYPAPPTYYYARNASTGSTVDNQNLADKEPMSTSQPASEGNTESELVLKARIADGHDGDFIEVELDMNARTMNHLISVLCAELNITKDNIVKVRKLPNTIIRKDKDVSRLMDFQEIEVVIDKSQR